MPKPRARTELKGSIEQKEILKKVSRKTGKSMNWILWHALDYWLMHEGKKEVPKLAGQMHEIQEEYEAKMRETDTGDFLGSYKKRDDKLESIAKAYKAKRINRFTYGMLRMQTIRNYKKTQEIKKKRLKRRLGITERLKESKEERKAKRWLAKTQEEEEVEES